MSPADAIKFMHVASDMGPRRARDTEARAPRMLDAQVPTTLEGSFSAVSTPIFATKYSFCSVFQDLQNELAEILKLAQKKIANSAKSQ